MSKQTTPKQDQKPGKKLKRRESSKEVTNSTQDYDEGIADTDNKSQSPLLEGDEIAADSMNNIESEQNEQEQNSDSNAARLSQTHGARVTFLNNSDPYFKGLAVSINRSTFPTLDSVFRYLEQKLEVSGGIKYILRWDNGKPVKDNSEFKNGGVYAVSNTKVLRRSGQGATKDTTWSQKQPTITAGKLRKDDAHLFKANLPGRTTPYVISLMNNLQRGKKDTVIINPQTENNFEDFKKDLFSNGLPVYAIFSSRPPYKRIESFSQLFTEFKKTDVFIACGEEKLPEEIIRKGASPVRALNLRPPNRGGSWRQPKPGYGEIDRYEEESGFEEPYYQSMHQRYDGRYDRAQLARSYPRYDRRYDRRFYPTSRESYEYNRYNLYRPRNGATVRNWDSVQIEIDGRIKEYYLPSQVDPYDDGSGPDKALKTDWVYGFRGKDTRQNLLILPQTEELVYFVASVVVLYDRNNDTQRHYTWHNEEITCMELHPNQTLIATGQMEGKSPENWAHVRIWSSDDLSTYSVVGLGTLQTRVVSVGFSKECKDGSATEYGKYMCIVDGTGKHMLSIWDWQDGQTGQLVARATSSNQPEFGAKFYPDDDTLLLSYGKERICFWKIFWDSFRRKKGRVSMLRNGIVEDDGVPKYIHCVDFIKSIDRDGNPVHLVLTGDSRGRLMLWEPDRVDAFSCVLIFQAHKSPITAMSITSEGKVFTGAGNIIKEWDTTNLDNAGQPTVLKSRQIPEGNGNIRSIVPLLFDDRMSKLYVGTTKNCILEGNQKYNFQCLVQGHSDSVWAIVSHPQESTFITAGIDRLVIKWSAQSHKVVWKEQVEKPCTCIAMDPSCEFIALGTANGRFIVLDAFNGRHANSVQVGHDVPINCIAFSPSGDRLALGSHDGLIHIYAVLESGQAFRKIIPSPIQAHPGTVFNIDWSTDGDFLQSVGDDFDLVYWDMNAVRIQDLHGKNMRGVDWQTNTCQVGYNLVGPWSNMESGEHVRIVNRSMYPEFFITGDNLGRIRLYKYPSSRAKAEFRSVKVYSSEVTAAIFANDDSLVLTAGGTDVGLVQWGLVDPYLSTRTE